MWESAKALPFGRLSIRNMCMFAAAMFVATFLYTLLMSPTAHAADVEWNGDSLMYQGNEYKKQQPAAAGDSHKLPVGTIIYRYDEPVTSSPGNPTTKAHLIYFAPGTDPTTATAGQHVVYTLTPPNTFSNPTAATAVSVAPQATPSEGTTSCAVQGIGWIVCPITNFLASAMDHLFKILAELLEVRPVQTSQENALYRAWSYMRNFANISFVVAFLIIIYAQLTSIGLSNYDIKKMLPRLIIAAILVNISYWICAVAIDVSNIAGWSIQEIFISMRNSLVGAEGNSWSNNVLSFESVAGVILSGGTAAAAAVFAGYSIVLSAGTLTAALYMLLPILVGVIIAALVALLIMAARQAIITILVIVSPLAFVAYLLPNTEKYYEKWQSLGLTMLLLFPIFSFVFGGSQLAGMAIIQNADSINLILLGMGVQVAPVVITPLLAKFSGSLLARVAGVINNPGRGLIDRTRKFAEERRDQTKARAFAGPLNRRRDAFARLGRRLDHNKRAREGWQQANQASADANWTNSRQYSDIQQRAMAAELMKNRGEADAQTRFEAAKRTNSAIQNLELDARASKLNLDLSKASVNADWEEIRAGRGDNIVTPAGLAGAGLATYVHNRVHPIEEAQLNHEIEESRLNSAKRVQKHLFSEELYNDSALQARAGGIDANGAQRALANALRERHQARGEAVEHANSIIEHLNLSDSDTLRVAEGNTITGKLTTVTDDIQEAAIKRVASGGNIKNINQLFESLDLTAATGNENHRIAYAESLKKNSSRPKYIGFRMMDEIEQGTHPTGQGGLDIAIKSTVEGFKFSPEVLVSQDQDALERMLYALQRDRASYNPAALADLKTQITTLKSHDILKTRIGERGKWLDQIESLI